MNVSVFDKAILLEQLFGWGAIYRKYIIIKSWRLIKTVWSAVIKI